MAKVIPITWDDVDRAFTNGACPDDCPHLHSWRENHGEGMYEPLCECTLSSDKGQPEDCPIIEKFVSLYPGDEDADDDQEEAPCESPS